MVGQWLPEPPVGSSLSDEISAPSVIIVDSDNDDGIEIVENDIEALGDYNEYRLLTDADNLTEAEASDESDDEETENPVQLRVFAEVHQQNSNDEQTTEDEISANTDEPRDIAVDCDKVRAAMANITLPDSATPSWAATIPDSEWCSYLQNRIRSLQEQNSKSSGSQ